MAQNKSNKSERPTQNKGNKSSAVASINDELAQQVLNNPDFIERINRDLPEVIMQVTTTHRGPLPDPETLAKYNQILPEAAERIIAMAEKE